jgi:hypothetical protein
VAVLGELDLREAAVAPHAELPVERWAAPAGLSAAAA